MKKRIRGFICILLIVAVYLFFTGVNKGYFLKIKEEDIVSTTEELRERVMEELEKGSDLFTVYVKDFKESEVKNINGELDGFWGHVDTYRAVKSMHNDLTKTEIRLKISDNYYAYQYYKNNMDISDHPTALKTAKKAKAVLKKIIKKGMSDYEKELAIHDYLVKNAKYGFLAGNARPYSYLSYGVLVSGKGVCNSYAEAMQLLLMMVDVESRIIVGTADKVDHAWNLVKLDGNWYHVDATWDDPVPDEKGRILRTYFNITDKMMESTHVWKKENYPKAVKIDYNYYKMEKRYCKNYEEFKKMVNSQLKTNPKKIDIMTADYKVSKYQYDFILKAGNARSIRWQTYGEAPCTSVVIQLSY